MLYRNSVARSVLRAISSSNASVARSTLSNNVFKAHLTSSARFPARASSLALTTRKPVTTALVRYASSVPGSTNVPKVSITHVVSSGRSLIFVCRKPRLPRRTMT